MDKREIKIYHIVYKTVNLKNGKYYIGKHSTKDLNDGYLGSGKGINRAIKKYGRGSFNRVIIAIFNSEKEALKYETKIVDENIVKDPKTYNMTTGGMGWNTKEAKEMCEKYLSDHQKMEIVREKIKKSWQNPERKEKQSKITSLNNKKRWKENKEYRELMSKVCSEKSKKLWECPEFREKICSINRKRLEKLWQNMEYKKEMCEMNKGEKNPSSKLKTDDVKKIKKLLKEGYTLNKLSKMFNVGISTIHRIKSGECWGNVTI